MFSAQQILQPSILNKRTRLPFSQTDSEPFIQTLLQQSDEGGAISSLSSAQSLLSQLWENFVYRLPGVGARFSYHGGVYPFSATYCQGFS